MLNLVIVEDESNIRDCLVHLFPWESLGIRVAESFSNGQDAFRYLSTEHADILLTDIRLPNISGLDLIRMLRENDNPIEIVILTGYKHFDYAQQAIRYQVHDFLLKPIKYEELTAAMLRIKESLEKVSHNFTVYENEEKNDTYHQKIITTAKNYVQKNLSDATLESTAVHVHLSPGYFSWLFHKITQSTFSDYLTCLRMERAAELLGNIEFKTYEISLMVGYDNPKNFTRAFKQYFNVTPREYRNKIFQK